VTAVPVPSRASRAAFALLFGLALAFNAIAVLTPGWLPMGDVGGWIELIDVVARHDDPATLYAATYLPPTGLEPNSLVVHVGSWLCTFMRADEAARALTLWYAVGTPLAVLLLAVTLGRSRWLALLSAPMVFNALFNVGLLNFLAAFPLLFVAPALARRLALHGRWRDGVALAAVSVALFYAHVLAFMMGLGFAGLVLLLDLRRPRDLLRLAALAPAGLLLGRWVWRKYVEAEPTEAGLALAGPDGLGLVFETPAQRMAAFHDWGLRLFRDAADETLFLIALGTWLALMAASQAGAASPVPSGGETSGDARPARAEARGVASATLELLTFGALAAWLALPSHMQEIQIIAERAVMPLLILLTLWPRVDLDRGRARWLLVPAVFGALVYPWAAQARFGRFDREVVAGLPAMIQALPPRSRLAFVMYDTEAPVTYMGPHWHLAKALMAVENGGVTDDSFAIRPHCPVQFRPGQSPTPLSREFWNDDKLLRWDYVLLWGREVPREARAHPLLAVVSEDAGWHLLAVRRPTPGPRLMAGGTAGETGEEGCAGSPVQALHAGTDDDGVTALDVQCPRGGRRHLGPAEAKARSRVGCRDGETLIGLHGYADTELRALGAVCMPAPETPWCTRRPRSARARADEARGDADLPLTPPPEEPVCRITDGTLEAPPEPEEPVQAAQSPREEAVVGVARGEAFQLRCPRGQALHGILARVITRPPKPAPAVVGRSPGVEPGIPPVVAPALAPSASPLQAPRLVPKPSSPRSDRPFSATDNPAPPAGPPPTPAQALSAVGVVCAAPPGALAE
jgi:hypothetical protein